MIGIRSGSIAVGGGSLARTAANAQSSWTERHGLILRLESDDGLVGLGEASPLPSYSSDGIDSCRVALSRWLAGDISIDAADIGSIEAESAKLSAELPAARFAIETALFDLAARARGCSVAALFGEVHEALPTTRLLSGDVLADARSALALGITSFKLKIGRNFESELETIRALRELLPESAELRLDANRAFSPREARAAIDAVAGLGIAFIEEPCEDLDALGEVPIPVALDEGLRDANPPLDRASILVLKPAVLGGFTPCFALAETARARGLDVVVSHLFSGPIALAASAELALAIGSERACGLDRHFGLSAWPEAPLPQFRDARIESVGPGLAVEL